MVKCSFQSKNNQEEEEIGEWNGCLLWNMLWKGKQKERKNRSLLLEELQVSNEGGRRKVGLLLYFIFRPLFFLSLSSFSPLCLSFSLSFFCKAAFFFFLSLSYFPFQFLLSLSFFFCKTRFLFPNKWLSVDMILLQQSIEKHEKLIFTLTVTSGQQST